MRIDPLDKTALSIGTRMRSRTKGIMVKEIHAHGMLKDGEITAFA